MECRGNVDTNTAAGAPASATTLVRLGRGPFPRPLKLHRRASACGVVADQLDLWVLVQVGVRLKLSCHEVVQVSRTRGEDKRQAVDGGVDEPRGRNGRGAVHIVYAGHGQMLAKDEGEFERELFVVREADQESGRAVAGRRFGVLQPVFSMASHG
jgi:hypothetical protein